MIKKFDQKYISDQSHQNELGDWNQYDQNYHFESD